MRGSFLERRSCPADGSAELWRLWKRVFLVQHNYTRIQTRPYIRMYIARQMEKRLGGYFIFSSSNHWKIRTRVSVSHVRKIRVDTGRTYIYILYITLSNGGEALFWIETASVDIRTGRKPRSCGGERLKIFNEGAALHPREAGDVNSEVYPARMEAT